MSLAHAYTTPEPDGPVRVMIADDSAVVRGLTARWLAAEPGLELVGTANDGEQALTVALACDPDVLVLDVEMPRLSGLEVLPRLLAQRPLLRVVMASTLTSKGAAVTMKALSLGAADYIAKPEARMGGADVYREELFAKLRALGAAARRRRQPPKPVLRAVAKVAEPAAEAGLRPWPTILRKPDVIAIGSSTGGPQALQALLAAATAVRQPILVCQHMPKTFTPILAEHLAKAAGRPAAEAVDGETVLPGRIYVAPGDQHLTVVRDGAGLRLRLDQTPPVNFCRPAVDPLFASLAAACGDRVLAIVLTGMGHDGRDGARALVEARAPVIAQDEASSVVWGMPGAVVGAGLACAQGPVARLAELVTRLSKGERP